MRVGRCEGCAAEKRERRTGGKELAARRSVRAAARERRRAPAGALHSSFSSLPFSTLTDLALRHGRGQGGPRMCRVVGVWCVRARVRGGGRRNCMPARSPALPPYFLPHVLSQKSLPPRAPFQPPPNSHEHLLHGIAGRDGPTPAGGGRRAGRGDAQGGVHNFLFFFLVEKKRQKKRSG